jgi:hypothetical protein
MNTVIKFSCSTYRVNPLKRSSFSCTKFKDFFWRRKRSLQQLISLFTAPDTLLLCTEKYQLLKKCSAARKE